MANNDNNRVTKDISARKNTQESAKLSIGIREAAEKAAQEARVEKIIANYDEYILEIESKHGDQVISLKEEHVKEISELKSQYAKSIDALRQSKAAAMSEGAANAKHEFQGRINALLSKIKTLDGEVKGLNGQLQTKIDECDNITNSMKSALLKKDGVIAELNGKVNAHPNSWIQLHFKGKNRKQRTCFRKFNAIFKEAAEELCKDIDTKYEELLFRERDVKVDGSKTLEENDIPDGSVVTYEKRTAAPPIFYRSS